MNILIKEIEIESEKYNMKLNKEKCEFISSDGEIQMYTS